MILYYLLAAVLILAFRVKLNHDTKESSAALAFFALCYVLPGLITRFSGIQYTWHQYYLFMGSASFALIVLYQSLDAKMPLLLAGLLEATLILFNILGVLGFKWVPKHYVDTVTIINYVELAILVGSWGIGDILGGRRLYSKLYHLDWPVFSVNNRALVTPEKKDC